MSTIQLIGTLLICSTVILAITCIVLHSKLRTMCDRQSDLRSENNLLQRSNFTLNTKIDEQEEVLLTIVDQAMNVTSNSKDYHETKN